MIKPDDDLSRYKVVIAPMMFMVQDGFAEKAAAFVQNGGCFVTSYLSGLVDKDYLFYQGGYPGPLKELLGVWVEEQDALPAEKTNHFTWNGKEYEAHIICDLIHPLSDLRALIAENKKVIGDIDYFRDKAYHISDDAGDAEVLGTYTDDFYQGSPVLTENASGKGHSWYVGTSSTPEFYRDLISTVAAENGVKPAVDDAPDGVEVAVRKNDKGTFAFYIDHRNYSVDIRRI